MKQTLCYLSLFCLCLSCTDKVENAANEYCECGSKEKIIERTKCKQRVTDKYKDLMKNTDFRTEFYEKVRECSE